MPALTEIPDWAGALLADPADLPAPEPWSAGAPVFGSMVWKPAVRKRNDCAYLTLRSWSAEAKPADLDQFKELKRARPIPADVVQGIAGELTNAMKLLLGDAASFTVCNVAGGHSRRPDHLARQIAEATAGNLGWRFMQAFADRHLTGSSHPKASANLPPLEIVALPEGPAIVVDDLATSGAHIEEALGVLRARGVPCFGIAWLSGCAVKEQQDGLPEPAGVLDGILGSAPPIGRRERDQDVGVSGDQLVTGVESARERPTGRVPLGQGGKVLHDREPAPACSLGGPLVGAAAATADHDRIRRQGRDERGDALAVQSAPAANDSDSHVPDSPSHDAVPAIAGRRALVQKLAGLGLAACEIALVLGTSEHDVADQFAHELRIGAIEANATVAKRLFAMTATSPAAAAFWLKSRAGWRERPATGKGEAPDLAAYIESSVVAEGAP